MLAHYFENTVINTHKLGYIAFVLAMLSFTSLTWADVHDPLDADPYVRYVQGELGRVSVEPMSPAGSVPQSTASESVYSFGLVIQRAERPGTFQYGWEGGVRLGYGSNRSMFVYLADTGSSVGVKSDLWTADVTFGGFASASLANRVRFYVSAGPVVYWGRASGADQDTTVAQGEGTAVTIDLTDSGDDVGATWYARAGAEWMFSPNIHVGVSVRKVDARLDFGQRGRVHMDEPSYLLTLGYVY